MTFVVELQNVSDKPVIVQGTRYGDSVSPPWPGKSASDEFAPHLCDCEFLDRNGKPLARPVRAMLGGDTMMSLSSGLGETIAPGKSLVFLVRPTGWDLATVRMLTSGEYQARLHYHGPAPAAQAEIKRHWPDKTVASAWNGDVVSAAVPFTIADSKERRGPKLMRGPESNGLEAAAEYQSSARTAQGQRDTASATFPHGMRLGVNLLVKNVSEKDISFWSETWRQDDKVTLIDPDGKESVLTHPWYSGWARVERWTLKPGQVAVLPAIGLGIANAGQNEKAFDLPIGSLVAVKPGLCSLRDELRFNAWQRTGKDGQQIPGKDDWQGTLTTGATSITVRHVPPRTNRRLSLPDCASSQPTESPLNRERSMSSVNRAWARWPRAN